MKKTGIVIAALLLASACNGGGTANNSTANASAPEPSAKIVARRPVPPVNAAEAAPDLESARVLIGQIYGPYTRGNTPDLGRGIYTPELNVAIARQSDMDSTGLGYDPFCRCQDFENFRYTIQSVEPRAGGARAVVSFTNLGESHNVTLLLDYRGDRWLVADIQEGTDSLLAGGRLR